MPPSRREIGNGKVSGDLYTLAETKTRVRTRRSRREAKRSAGSGNELIGGERGVSKEVGDNVNLL